MTKDIANHALFGGIFAITGAWARTMLCTHWWHQMIVGGIAIFVEATAMVVWIG